MAPNVRRGLLAVIAMLALAMPAAARQSSMTSADVDRLQQDVNDAGQAIATLRSSDTAAARRLQSELDDLQDEVIYLKVKLRKEPSVARSEYTALRDRIADLQTRAGNGGAPAAAPATPEAAPAPAPRAGASASSSSSADGRVPVGAELDVRLQTALNSGTAQVEDRFEATTLVDYRQDGRVVVPAGSVVRGVVTDVKSAGRVERKGSLSLSFDQITVNGRAYPIRGTVTQAIEEGGYKEDAGKIGAGAAVGGILGGIFGGAKGALAGVLIGGGGTVAATEGKQVDLKPGTILRMRFDSPLELMR
ncbi:MAG: hypothetical protein AB7O67_19960 [Vicinamibacterales bacterium]